MATTWTDPNGTVHQYQTAGDGLEAKARRAVERQQVWAGIDPTFDNQQFQVSDDGKIVKQEHVNKLLAGAMLAGPLAVGLLAPGAAAAGGTSATSGGTAAAIPSTAVQAGGVTGGILPGSEAGLVSTFGPKAASTATSLLSSWLGPAISAGAGLGGALIQKSSNDKATNAQTDAADKALALTKQMYEQDRADYAPYRNVGAFSLGELGNLVGMPKDFGTQAVQAATAPKPATPQPQMMPMGSPTMPKAAAQPAIVDNFSSQPAFQSLRDLGAQQQSASSFIRMRAPDGEEADIPPHEVALFESHGAQRI